MDAVIKAITDNPGAAIPIAIISLAVNVWLANRWVKSIGQNFEFATKFGGAIESTNDRLKSIEFIVDRIERRGD